MAAVQLEAARTLRAIRSEPAVQTALKKKWASLAGSPSQAKLVNQLAFLLDAESEPRPQSVEAWQALLAASSGWIEAKATRL